MPAEITFSDVMLADVCFLNESNVTGNGNRVRRGLVVCPDSQIKVNLNNDGRNTCL